jgi:hypothetical protein
MAKKQSKKVAAAFHEVFHNKPSTVDTSKSAKGQRKQMIAIALSKARQAGAKIPKGGSTTLDRGSMKAEMCLQPADNLAAKSAFASGKQDARMETRKRKTNGVKI